MLAILPLGGSFVFTLPGTRTSLGRFRSRLIELCERFVAEPVFREGGPAQPEPGLQSTIYQLKKR